MIDGQVLTFTLVAAALTLSPGADTMLVVRNVLRGGRHDGVVTAFGICSGLFLHAILSALGVSIILMHSAMAFHWVKIAGALVWQFMAMRSREFVQACICLGMSDSRVIFRHILPNCLSPIIVTGSLIVATAILIESALSFLGLGDPNTMSWGFMIGAGRTFLRTAWWLCTIRGIAILLTVLAINLLGEGLNDTLNPRLRNR